MFNLEKLKTHIKTYHYRDLNELLLSNEKSTISLVQELVKAYNKRFKADKVFRQNEMRERSQETDKSNDISIDKNINILNRVLNEEIKNNLEIQEAFFYNIKKFNNKDVYIDLKTDRIDGTVLIEEQTTITKNSVELKKESKITTKKIVSIELNTTVAKNILNKIDRNSKFLKDFCSDYIKSFKSNKIDYDESGNIRFPSLAFSVQVKKYISDKIKNNEFIGEEEISALNKQIDCFSKIDLMPIETLRKIAEIGFNQSKELMTTITSDNMLLENKQIVLDADKILQEEEINIKNKKDEFFNALQNFNIKK